MCTRCVNVRVHGSSSEPGTVIALRRRGDAAGRSYVLQGVVLLEYLCRAGSDQVVADALEHVYDLDELTRYQYINEDGTDVGGNGTVRARGRVAWARTHPIPRACLV